MSYVDDGFCGHGVPYSIFCDKCEDLYLSIEQRSHNRQLSGRYKYTLSSSLLPNTVDNCGTLNLFDITREEYGDFDNPKLVTYATIVFSIRMWWVYGLCKKRRWL